ncbi:hypothetical protein GCM10027598_50210 [Amycolatopsis oliviviridis]|uniref:Integral membrane protein n=1 Tax=Amycolatopsis oliviviridis TaxID=1471590 RepID=A0ABQ3M2Y9_9PSEU|nr:hypothetical protein [Amycolatopsis oliviviridis]GHH31471.1 hypothetical protein GCM10017790_66700 [Amycolatopsis oliviviridis]
MQPNPPQPGPPKPRPPKPRASAGAAMTAGFLGLLTAAMIVWFALYNVVYGLDPAGGWSGPVIQNAFGGIVTAGLLVVAAGFTFARRIPGAWTLFGLCAFYVMAVFVAAPLVWGTPFGTHLKWIFGFDKSNGVATALASIFGILTAVMAAIAGSVKARG